MRILASALCLALAACGKETPATNQPDANQARTDPGCADHLEVQVDRNSFETVGIGAAAEIDRWGKQSADTFKAAAAELCGEGWLNSAGLPPLKQLSVQYAAGANNASVWQDEDRPGVVILEYAFSSGAPPPGRADVRDAIRCWAKWEEDLCSPRLP